MSEIVVHLPSTNSTMTCVMTVLAQDTVNLGKSVLGLKSPSEARMKAQRKIWWANIRKRCGITVKERLVRSYPLFQPVESDSPDYTEESLNADKENWSDEDDLPLSSLKREAPDTTTDSPVIECSIKTKTFGLKKPKVMTKKSCCYKCSVCLEKNSKNWCS